MCWLINASLPFDSTDKCACYAVHDLNGNCKKKPNIGKIYMQRGKKRKKGGKHDLSENCWIFFNFYIVENIIFSKIIIENNF